MKFCYLDESGTGSEPIAVMVGIITDHHRMKPTKSDWNTLLKTLSDTTGRQVKEIHTLDLYAGNSPFRQLDSTQRTHLINEIFKWLKERKHDIVYTAVNKLDFVTNIQQELFFKDIGTLWRHMAFHTALSLQKYLQGFEKNKGNCVLIFDNKVNDQEKFTRLILNPPQWSDTYYDKRRKQEQLDQIVDVPHFVDSKEVGLIQLADFLCFFLRKHIELELKLATPKYDGEGSIIKEYVEKSFKLSIPKTNIFLNKGRCSAADYFHKYAPTIIR